MADEQNEIEREEELVAVAAIYPEVVTTDDKSLECDIAVSPSTPLLIRFVPQTASWGSISGGHDTNITAIAHVERDVRVSHLPPLKVRIDFPKGYPAAQAPQATLVTDHDWLPKLKVEELEDAIEMLWEDSGHSPVIFAYLDHLQQAAIDGFDINDGSEGCITLPMALERPLMEFKKSTELTEFNKESYDCGICLERKKGTACYKLERCEHIFCRECLQDFFNNAIKEGDIATVRCLDPDCGKNMGGARQRKVQRPLHPRELLAMGIEERVARRYVEMKRKKRLESDKNTIYCPREHCKQPARSAKHPPIPANLDDYPDSDSDTELAKQTNDSNASYDPNDRLSVCENPKCRFAFCRTCYKSWHGSFVRCYPRDPTELSAEEQASYDYIANSTSPCPTCNAATSKTEGCNHMICYQCKTHYCYLCSSWLSPDNPYHHFNERGKPCYQKLWDLEGGDNGGRNQVGENGERVQFHGARHWEQLAREVARQADEDEAREAAMQEAAQIERVREFLFQNNMREAQDLEARLADVQHDRELDAAEIQRVREFLFQDNMREALEAWNQDDDNDEIDEEGAIIPLDELWAEIVARDAAAANPPVENPPAQRVEVRGRGRGRGNPFHPAPANPRGQGGAAVRAHERGIRGRGRGRGRMLPLGPVHAHELAPENEFIWEEGALRRFADMALRDEEDDFSSDELGEEDEFVIR